MAAGLAGASPRVQARKGASAASASWAAAISMGSLSAAPARRSATISASRRDDALAHPRIVEQVAGALAILPEMLGQPERGGGIPLPGRSVGEAGEGLAKRLQQHFVRAGIMIVEGGAADL